MKHKKWMITAKRADFNEIARACGISPVLARLIRNRDVIGVEETRRFLGGKIEDLHDPRLLPDADKAVDILTEKIRNGNKIRIIGDYDVDGICSSFILWHSLRAFGGQADAMLPERMTDGYGINERYDVLAWTNYVVKRFGEKQRILLAGISMGAATVLMASELNLPKQVRGILADCPYTSPAEIISTVGKSKGIPMMLALPMAELGARIWGGFSLSSVSALSTVRLARVPILLIHGEADKFVPCEMSRRIAGANPKLIELHTFPGAGHGLSYLVDTERYVNLVQEFCGRIFSSPIETV